ncbi:MAG: CYTH domain-containing protein [Acidobacteria bacterium]|nr:CYTH domain-containing protein [Acidobacteriota bacterium]
MFGLAVCVRKRREVWLVENARIHMDRVTGLGTFAEIEVVVTRGMRQATRLMAALREALGIRQRDVIGTSYADLLRAPVTRSARSARVPATAGRRP